MLSMSVAGTIIIIFVVLVRSLFYHKMSKRICQIWGISIVALLMPFSFTFINKIYVPKQTLDIGNRIMEVGHRLSTSKDISEQLVGQRSASIKIYFYMYILSYYFYLIRLAVKYIEGERMLEEAILLPENKLFSEIQRKLNCNKVRLYSSDRIYSPISYGLRKPKIVFPLTSQMKITLRSFYYM